jgi:hypothetical protein
MYYEWVSIKDDGKPKAIVLLHEEFRAVLATCMGRGPFVIVHGTRLQVGTRVGDGLSSRFQGTRLN